ncbi:MAG: DUF192 domain-containing protein [Deltaproteobacteria bacterium]|nr:DUF192 domain-containing protein [Deltaproteobacteria bacterium]
MYNPSVEKNDNQTSVVDKKETAGVPQNGLDTEILKIHSSSSGKTLTVSVQLAVSESQQQMGLMFRKSMPESEGMLFVYPRMQRMGFWMKNTLIPLDMLFIDRDKKIVAIIEDANPHDETVLSPREKAMYVLEVNAGFAKKNQLKIGDKVSWGN